VHWQFGVLAPRSWIEPRDDSGPTVAGLRRNEMGRRWLLLLIAGAFLAPLIKEFPDMRRYLRMERM
jgi:hypothetical protein